MGAPFDLDQIRDALSHPAGWFEVGLVLLCFAIAWWVDRRVRLGAGAESRFAKIGAGGVNRLVFPLTALALLLVARALLRHGHEQLFPAIAIPFAIALALIRLLVYGLHNVFGSHHALATSERAIAFTIAGALLLYYAGILQEVRDALGEAHIPIGKSELSVLDLVRGLFVLILALVLSLGISGMIEQRLLRSATGDANARVVVGKLVRAVLLLVGILVALSVVGIDLTVLSVFGGALGVGLGLGLQKLASNYIAGFAILLDRSVRIGDMITVDNRTGIVTKATARYVVVHSLDNFEAIVPNEVLVTTTVINHSYTSWETRVGVPVQISYDSDLDLALRLMEEAAGAEPRVLRAPSPPKAFVNRFADHGIDLELVVWIKDPENGQQNLRSALNRTIWRAFRDHGIQISVPQREVRILGKDKAAAGPGATPRRAQDESNR